MPTQLLDARSIFLEAVEKNAPDQWPGFLDAACGDDAALRQRVEVLLAAHGQCNSLLDGSGLVATFDSPPTERLGTQIGPYKLLQQIGEGGMGVVYMAEQTEPVRRRVALKVIKPGMDTRQVIARFEAERQALAVMDHPNIARVLDAGTTGEVRNADFGMRNEGEMSATPHSAIRTPHSAGRPYFVMELVRGVPITQYCDENSLPIRDRLALFATVCQAIQHAHTKGIIHRDIKPTNVLVTRQDGQAVVKVIDFGIAKAMGQQLTDKTLFTDFTQMIGTPLYMSPEQAELSSTDIDTRSDIYSLGVLLYELLTSMTPFDKNRMKRAGYDEIRRIIREDEPARPSVRVSTLAEAAATVSAIRGSDPRRLSRLFRGELDWIVMKALEKDRNRRYDAANALAADVQRYLNDEPVLACPPSAAYRFRKFARRQKAALATAAVVVSAVLATVLALAVSNAQIREEQKQTKDALRREKHARENLSRALEREQQTTYIQRIARADYEIANNNWGEANELLDACVPWEGEPERRGWEWYYLKRVLDAPMHEVTASVHSVLGVGPDLAFSSDGRLLAGPGRGGGVILWDLTAGQQWALKEPTADGKQRPVLQVAFSPDGRWLVSAGDDGNVILWDLAARRPDRTLIELDQPGAGLAFSPDGRYLATAGADKWVRLWDVATWQERHKFHTDFPTRSLLGLAFSPNSQLLACAGENNTVKVWRVTTGREESSLVGHTEPVFSVEFSPEGDRLVSFSADLTARVWDLAAGGRELFSVRGHATGRRAVAFSHDGSRLAVAGGTYEQDIWIYDARTGRLVQTLVGHRSRVHALAFHPDGQRLVSSGIDRTVRIWDLGRGREVLSLRKHTSIVETVLFDPKGWRLATAGSDGNLQIWDGAPLGQGADPPKMVFSGHTFQVFDVAFSPDSPYLATASGDGTVRVCDWVAGRAIYTLQGHTGPAWAVVFGADGLLVSASKQAPVKFWDARTGKPLPLRLQGLETGVHKLALSRDSRLLATCGATPPYDLCLWEVQTGKQLHQLKGHKDIVLGVAFSPDGTLVAATSPDRTVRVWDSATGEQVRCFENECQGFAIAFSPDGRRLAAGFEQEAKVWDWQAQKELEVLSGHTHYIYSVAYSPNGRWLASASWRDVIIWDASTNLPMRRLNRHAGTIHDVEWTPDGRRLAVVSGSKVGEIELWDVSDLENN